MEIYTWLSRYFPEQFRQPTGRLGQLIGRLEGRHNEAANDFALEHLDVQRGDWVLEAGCGPGVSLQKLLRHVERGKVAGIDYSKIMLEQAQRRNAAAMIGSRLLLSRGDSCRLPFAPAVFDKILLVSVIYFLPEPVACLRELWRVQKRGGRIAIYMTSKADLEKEAFVQKGPFRLYTASEAVAMLQRAGYHKTRYATRTIHNRTGICFLGEK